MDTSLPPLSTGTPTAEYSIDSPLVAGLLADQFPDLAHLPLQRLDEGWDNILFHAGDDWLVRLPRRAVAAELISHEQRWLPNLAPQLTLPIPVPFRFGKPARGYPWPWSIVPWLKGKPADEEPPHPSQAAIFAAFLRSLHVTAPAEAPVNTFRGVPLRQRASLVEQRMQRLTSKTNLMTPLIQHIWEVALQAPLEEEPTWLHGDLHPRNVLVEQGLLTGIIDWGDITSGDRATDLAAVWMLFRDAQARRIAVAAYGSLSPATL